MQLFYALVERTVEQEHVPAARELVPGLVPSSPLACGLLTGKYAPGDERAADGRLSGANPFGDTLFTARNRAIADRLRDVAAEAWVSMAQAALAWVLGRPGVTAPILGARTPEQLRENVAALDVALTPAQRHALDAASAPAPAFPYGIFAPETVRGAVFGGAVVRGRGDR